MLCMNVDGQLQIGASVTRTHYTLGRQFAALDANGNATISTRHQLQCGTRGWPRYARHSLRMHGAGGASAAHTSERFCKASNLTVHSGWVVMRRRSSVGRHQQHPGTSCNDSEIASAVRSE